MDLPWFSIPPRKKRTLRNSPPPPQPYIRPPSNLDYHPAPRQQLDHGLLPGLDVHLPHYVLRQADAQLLPSASWWGCFKKEKFTQLPGAPGSLRRGQRKLIISTYN